MRSKQPKGAKDPRENLNEATLPKKIKINKSQNRLEKKSPQIKKQKAQEKQDQEHRQKRSQNWKKSLRKLVKIEKNQRLSNHLQKKNKNKSIKRKKTIIKKKAVSLQSLQEVKATKTTTKAVQGKTTQNLQAKMETMLKSQNRTVKFRAKEGLRAEGKNEPN